MATATHWSNRVGPVAAAALALCLPLAPQLAPLAMAVLIIAVAAPEIRSGKWNSVDWRGPLPWMALFYLAHVAGLLWSSNMEFAQLDLGIKLPLLLFPALAFFTPRAEITGSAWRWFIRANALAVVLCTANALLKFGALWTASTNGATYSAFELTVPFFSSEFSCFLHPSYMAMYLTWALLLLIRPNGADSWGRGWTAAFAGLFLLGILLCASKAGWAILLVCGGLVLVERWADKALRKAVLAALAGMVALGVVLYFSTDLVHEKVQQVVAGMRGEAATTGSTSDRQMVWQAAATLVAEHPALGAGTGDVKDELLQRYLELGFMEPYQKRLNAHSQFMNTAVALGLVGVALLVLMLVVPLVAAWRRGNLPMLYFLLLNLLNWAVESMLEVQAGVLFFAFFAWAIAMQHKDSMAVRTNLPHLS